MRYIVTQTETIKYVLEADNEEQVHEFLKSNTTRELRALKHNIKTSYTDAIIEKTLLPADFHCDDDIPVIFDDIPEKLLKCTNDEMNKETSLSISLETLPFN